MEHIQRLSDMIFDLKDKLTDFEFKNIMEAMQKIAVQKPILTIEILQEQYNLDGSLAIYIVNSIRDPDYTENFVYAGGIIPFGELTHPCVFCEASSDSDDPDYTP